MRREKGFAVLLEVGLIGVEHAVEPREQLLGAVVSVKDNGDAVGGCYRADIVGGGNGAGNGGLLVLVVNALSWCRRQRSSSPGSISPFDDALRRL
jgi:hypothetical protein